MAAQAIANSQSVGSHSTTYRVGFVFRERQAALRALAQSERRITRVNHPAVAGFSAEEGRPLEAEFNLNAAGGTALSVGPDQTANRANLGLSILIATHRRPAGLRRLLAALRPQVDGRDDRQVIVVNDGTHDETYARIVEEFADIVSYTALEKNVGIAATRNACFRQATGTYAVFTDDDCEPPGWWLDWLTARLIMHPEIDVVCGTTIPLWSKRDLRERVQAAWFIPSAWRDDDRNFFVTANAAIRCDLLRAVGGFGFDGFRGAGEDTELVIRLHRAEGRFLIDWNWWVAHEVGATVRSLAATYRRYGEGNGIISSIWGLRVPPPTGIERPGFSWLDVFRAPLRDYAGYIRQFNGNRLERLAAIVIRMRILLAFVRGLKRTFRGDPKSLRPIGS